MKTTFQKGLVIATAILFVASVIALGAVGLSDESAAAGNYDIECVRVSQGDYFNGNTDVTYRVYVNAAGIENNLTKRVVYNQYKLKDLNDVNKLKFVGRKTEDRVALIEDKVVYISELKKIPDNSDRFRYYFEINTKVNSAFRFEVVYEDTTNTGEGKKESSSFADTLFVTLIDNTAPKVTCSQMWSSGRCKLDLTVTDEKLLCNASGIKEVKLFSKRENGGFTLVDGSEKNCDGVNSYKYTVYVDYGKVDYYYQAVDNAGNDSGKILLCSFTSQTYDEVAEANINNALADMGKGGYNNYLLQEATNAFTDYNTVIKNADSTEEQKQEALKYLKEVYGKYLKAKENKDNGVMDVKIEVINGDYLSNFTVENASHAFFFVPAGDEVELVLTLARYDFNKYEKAELLRATGMEKADELYVVNVRARSDELTDGYHNEELTTPMLLRFDALEKAKNVKATQAVKLLNGETTYYDCQVIKYADGTYAVAVMRSAGEVNILVEKESNDLLWLLWFALIPLFIGLAFLGYYLVKSRKIKAKNGLTEQKVNTEQSANDKKE